MCACVPKFMYYVVQYPWRPAEGIKFLKSGVTRYRLFDCWELNLGPLNSMPLSYFSGLIINDF